MHRVGIAVFLSVFLLLPFAVEGERHVNSIAVFSATAQQPPFGRPRREDEDSRRLEREQAKRANKERHESLKRDTDKLLQLATELKQSVDRSNENTLSLDVIKKAEEIEKLAKRVKDKMKD